jgi:MFS family permease
VQGIGGAMLQSSSRALAAESVTEDLAGRAQGYMTTAHHTGFILGPSIGGIMIDYFSWRWSFFLLVPVGLVGTLLALANMRRGKTTAGQSAGTVDYLGAALLFGITSSLVFLFDRRTHQTLDSMASSLLGALFVVYLAGSLLTPWTGWAVARFGRRRFTVRVIAIWVAGIALTLAPSLPLIIVGLAISAACGLICQAISTAYVTVTAKAGRSSAVGLYVTSFYVGGSFGAALGGLAWNFGGWPACVALVVAMLAIMAAIVIFAWARRVPASTDVPPIEPP